MKTFIHIVTGLALLHLTQCVPVSSRDDEKIDTSGRTGRIERAIVTSTDYGFSFLPDDAPDQIADLAWIKPNYEPKPNNQNVGLRPQSADGSSLIPDNVPGQNNSPLTTKKPCPCAATQQYNPVCGSDSVTYWNMAFLNCATACNPRILFKFEGTCVPQTSG